jgi:hypothetical protein
VRERGSGEGGGRLGLYGPNSASSDRVSLFSFFSFFLLFLYPIKYKEIYFKYFENHNNYTKIIYN